MTLAQLQSMLNTCSMPRLCDLLESTTNQEDTLELYTVRGWILDAMEAKNPEGFEAWLDSDDNDDSDARKYLL